MARPVGDVFDQRLVAVGERKDPAHDVDVRQLVGTTGVVDVSGFALFEDRGYRGRGRSSTNSQLLICIPSP